MHLLTGSSLLLSALCPLLANSISLDITSSASVKNASSVVAKDMLTYYHGADPGQIPGLFGSSNHSSPWWEAGAIWGSLIDYWNYTGDTQYVRLVQEALLSQMGPHRDYMNPTQTKTAANDDQAIWALAAMRAAELGFPQPSSSPSWLDVAIRVFNDQADRWDTKSCGGGLHWQIFTFNNGYDYKQTLSHGAFFQLAARLAKFTDNQTYADWATKSYDWTSSVGLISDDYKVFDGASTSNNCSEKNQLQRTYAAGAFMYGSAVMANLTYTNPTWKDRTKNLLSAMSVFFTADNATQSPTAGPGIMFEAACEPSQTCQAEELGFKGLTAQWMGETMQVAPFTRYTIMNYLQKSAEGAAKQCSGGRDGTTCGTRWTESKYDGKTGLEQEYSAFNVILANLAVPATFSAPTNTDETYPAAPVSDGL